MNAINTVARMMLLHIALRAERRMSSQDRVDLSCLTPRAEPIAAPADVQPVAANA
jgi:hypothetical protein